MEDDKVKEFLNKHILGNSELAEATRLGYRGMFLEILETYMADVEEESRTIAVYIADAMSQMSTVPRSGDELSVYKNPQTFKAIVTVFTDFQHVAEYAMDHYDGIESGRFKGNGAKEELKALLEYHKHTEIQIQQQFMSTGSIILPNGLLAAMKDFLCWGLEIILGRDNMFKFIEEFNKAQKILNSHYLMINMALKSKTGKLKN